MGKRWLALWFCVLAGCDPASSACGGTGEYFDDGVGRYCAYAVIEGGFLCPAAMPFRFDFGGGAAAICSDRSLPARDLPEGACAAIRFRCEDGRPAGPPAPDGGVSDAGDPPSLMCGDATPVAVVVETTPDVEIDTRAAANRVATVCGDVSAPGADAFVALDAVAGQRWHVHASLEASEPRDPHLILLDGACDPRTCVARSTACAGVGDEHLDFVVPANGRYWVGIDDGAAGGARYHLGFYLATCGDGVEVHGEACDDGNLTDGDGCDRRCRVETGPERPRETEPNDTPVTANVATFDATIDGDVGGPGACTYADYFVIAHPGGALDVDVLGSDGSPCTSGAATPFHLTLFDAAGDVVVERMVDPAGCAIVRAADLPAGEHLVRVGIDEALEAPAAYRLRFTAR